MGENIFINYRRGEDQAAAGRLYDQLEAAFTRERLFIDVDNIAPGRDFTEELATRVAQCDVFLAVVGRRWAEVVDLDGSRRLDNPNDWVRVEIESAQRLGKYIIPVLVDGAEMPRPDKLPVALQPFARRNAVRLTHERFRADVQALVVAIRRLSESERAQRISERPAPAREATVSGQAAGRRLAPIAAVAMALAIAAGGGFFAWRSTSAPLADIGASIQQAAATPSLPARMPSNGVAATLSAAADKPGAAEVKAKAIEATPAPAPSATLALLPLPSAKPSPTASATVAPATTPTPVASAADRPETDEVKAKAIEATPAPAPSATLALLPLPPAKPSPTASATVAPATTPTPVASAAADKPETGEVKAKPIEATPAPAPSATLALLPLPSAKSSPTASATVAPATTPTPVVSTADRPETDEVKAKPIEATPAPAPSATLALLPLPSAKPSPTASATVAPATTPTPVVSTADRPETDEVKAKAIEATPALSAAPTSPPSPLATPAPSVTSAVSIPRGTPAPLAAAADAPAQIALAEPAPAPSKADLLAMTPLVVAELRRLGCYRGTAADWNAVDVRLGVDRFAQLAKLASLPSAPDAGLLAALKSEPDRFCAPQCSSRESAVDGRCVPKTCPANQILTRDGTCVARAPKPQPTTAARAPAQTGGKKCFTFNGSSYCE